MADAYLEELAKRKPLYRTFSGVEYLRIYRGLWGFEGGNIFPSVREICEEVEPRRERDVLDLSNPGIDWTPYRTFAESDYLDKKRKHALLSAWIPTDIKEIFDLSKDNSLGLDEDTWGDPRNHPSERLGDLLIVIIPENYYGRLRNLKVLYMKGKLRIKINHQSP